MERWEEPDTEPSHDHTGLRVAPAEPERIVAREPDQPPPVHEAPEQAPQPIQGLVEQVRQGRLDVGALIARTDAIESTVRRVDRQTIMLVGALALVLWTTRQALSKLIELEAKLEA